MKEDENFSLKRIENKKILCGVEEEGGNMKEEEEKERRPAS